MSCKCQSCGEQYKVDIIIPDKLWEKIKPEGKPEGAGLLCGKCIMERIEKISNCEAFCLTQIKVCDEVISRVLKAFNRRKYDLEWEK